MLQGVSGLCIIQSRLGHSAFTDEVLEDEPVPGSWVSYLTPPCSLPCAISRPLLRFMELRRRKGGKERKESRENRLEGQSGPQAGCRVGKNIEHSGK